MRRCLRSCGENVGTPAAVQARVIAVRSRSAVDADEHGNLEVHGRLLPLEREHGFEERLGNRNPACASRLRHRLRDAPAATALVDVSPGELLELAHAHPRRVEDEERQPVLRRQEPMNREHVLRCRRIDLRSQLVRQLHRLVADRVRDDSREVEHHREGHERLADRLARKLGIRQLAGELGDVGRCDLIDATCAEAGEDPAEVDPVRRGGSLRDVDPRAPPALGDRGQRRRSRLRDRRRRRSGIRIAASSPPSQFRRATASRIVRNEPPCLGVDSRPPNRKKTRYVMPPSRRGRRVIQALGMSRADAVVAIGVLLDQGEVLLGANHRA